MCGMVIKLCMHCSRPVAASPIFFLFISSGPSVVFLTLGEDEDRANVLLVMRCECNVGLVEHYTDLTVLPMLLCDVPERPVTHCRRLIVTFH